MFQRLTDAGLTIKLKKCQFAVEECVYLGHIIGKGHVQPEEHKTAAIQNYPRPLTKKQVHAFLGLTGYYRRFLPDYAGRAKPLTDLTQKHLPDSVVWTSECDAAFEDLKDPSHANCFCIILIFNYPLCYRQMLRTMLLAQFSVKWMQKDSSTQSVSLAENCYPVKLDMLPLKRNVLLSNWGSNISPPI